MSKDLKDYTNEELLDYIKNLKKAKRFGLVWEDKPEQVVKDVETKLPVLEEVSNRAIITDSISPTHLIIEGDNYHSLSTLNYTHANEIDVIYIDPPYNTGKEDFLYNDKYIDDEDSFRHSKWLSFMAKRLNLAKDLLAPSGILMISIDDNEMAHLRLLCDQIMGASNRLSIHHIQVRYGQKSLNEKKDFQELLEYVLIYAKDAQSFRANKPKDEYSFDGFNLDIKELGEPDEVTEIKGRKVEIFKKGSYAIEKVPVGNADLFKETWLSGSIYSGTGHGKTYQRIIEPRVEQDGLSTLYKIHGLGEDGLGYRYMINPQKASSSRGKMFTKLPVSKRQALENNELDRERPIINFYDFSGDFGNIRHEGGVAFNSGKKPIKMLKQLINYHTDKNAVVLDFFAGSGSTGHAVLDLNREDGGNRQFILGTNNEAGIAENITYERVKNVVNGYGKSDGVPANIRYFKTALVDKQKTNDQTRLAIIDRSADLIRVRENAFEAVIDETDLKVFKGAEHLTAIVFNPDKLAEHVKRIEELGLSKIVNLYVFSLSNYAYQDELPDTELEITACPIPESILEVYQRIFRKRVNNV